MPPFRRKYTKEDIIREANGILISIMNQHHATEHHSDLVHILNKTINEQMLCTTVSRREKNRILQEVDYELRSYFDH